MLVFDIPLHVPNHLPPQRTIQNLNASVQLGACSSTSRNLQWAAATSRHHSSTSRKHSSASSCQHLPVKKYLEVLEQARSVCMWYWYVTGDSALWPLSSHLWCIYSELILLPFGIQVTGELKPNQHRHQESTDQQAGSDCGHMLVSVPHHCLGDQQTWMSQDKIEKWALWISNVLLGILNWYHFIYLSCIDMIMISQAQQSKGNQPFQHHLMLKICCHVKIKGTKSRNVTI